MLNHVTHGDERILAGMFLLWGVAATGGNLWAGRLVDKFRSRHIINAMLCVAAVNFCAPPWTSGHTLSAALALTVRGICGSGLIVPQQHRLVQLSPHVAPLLVALNNTATYIGLACSGLLGGAVLQSIGGRYLSVVAAALIGFAWVLSEAAYRRIEQPGMAPHAAASRRTGTA